jgi:hypothetical protein
MLGEPSRVCWQKAALCPRVQDASSCRPSRGQAAIVRVHIHRPRGAGRASPVPGRLSWAIVLGDCPGRLSSAIVLGACPWRLADRPSCVRPQPAHHGPLGRQAAAHYIHYSSRAGFPRFPTMIDGSGRGSRSHGPHRNLKPRYRFQITATNDVMVRQLVNAFSAEPQSPSRSTRSRSQRTARTRRPDGARR